MEQDEKRLFVVLEPHMVARYSYMIEKFGFDGYIVSGFEGIPIGTSTNDILKRVWHNRVIKNEYKKLKTFIDQKTQDSKITQVYFSNTEGYIAHNFLKNVKRDFPVLELIGLQHGVFELSDAPQKTNRKLINGIFRAFFSFYPIGVGFGGKIADKYIVYNQMYKDFLVKKYNWDQDKVEVNLKFLKCELYDRKEGNRRNSNTALFLMQCLAKASLCSEQDEKYLNDQVLKYLAQKHERVLIKQHPACADESVLNLMPNCVLVYDLVDAFNQGSHAYSFASTTLLEAEIFDLEIFAIDSKRIGGDKSVYKLFANTINFDNEIDI